MGTCTDWLRPLRWHDLRHTFGSLLVAQEQRTDQRRRSWLGRVALVGLVGIIGLDDL